MTRRQSGFSLIELLVAVLIMGFGVLGVAALQVLSLQQNRGALLRAEANQLANDLIDRIRVNTLVTYSSAIDAGPAATTDCMINACSTIEMRDYDIAQWKCSITSIDDAGDPYAACAGFTPPIEGSLPNGQGSVALVGGVYEVTVEWDEDNDGTPSSITLRARVN